MAESIWSYESDVAPQRELYFSDVPRTGSRIAYTTPESRRYAAGVLAPAQAAIRQAEEEELKRRDDELAYRVNIARLEEGKEQSRMRREALEFINNPELATQLSAIDQKILSDPVQAQKELSDWMMKNISGIESSSAIKENITQLRERINQAQIDNRQKDSDHFTRVKMLAEAGQLDRATEEASKIKDSSVLGTANVFLEAQGAANKSAQTTADAEAKQKQDKDSQDAQQRSLGNIHAQLTKMKMVAPTPVAIAEATAAGVKPEASFDPLDLMQLEAMAEEVGVDPKLPPKELYKTIYKKSLRSRVDGLGNGGNVGEVIGTMTPTP